MRNTLIPLLSLLLLGCGAPPPPATTTEAEAPAPVPWDQRISDFLPAIDACIAQAPQSRTVSFVASGPHGVFVRLQGGEAKLDCRVDPDGQTHIAPSDESVALDGDGDALFVRGPGENPGGECYEAPEVRGADGALLGWMLDPAGC